MRKLLATFLVVALAFGGLPLLVSTSPALASWDWCWDDPIVQIGHHTVSISVGVPNDRLDQLTGDSLIVVHVGRDTRASIVSNDNVFPVRTIIVHDGHGDGATAVVTVHAKSSLPVEVKVQVDHHAPTVTDGTANHAIRVEIDN